MGSVANGIRRYGIVHEGLGFLLVGSSRDVGIGSVGQRHSCGYGIRAIEGHWFLVGMGFMGMRSVGQRDSLVGMGSVPAIPRFPALRRVDLAR